MLKLDLLMLAAAGGAFLAAFAAGLTRHSSRRARWTGVLLWALFGLGLLTRGLAPNLEIHENVFRLPATPAHQQLNLKEVVERERRMQFLAALLTISAGLGLACYYRSFLFGGGQVPGGVNASAGSQ